MEGFQKVEDLFPFGNFKNKQTLKTAISCSIAECDATTLLLRKTNIHLV